MHRDTPLLPIWRILLPLLLAASVLAPAAARAQPVLSRPEAHPGGILLVVTDKSGLVSNDSPLYLASNHGGWNPGDQAAKLSGRSDLRWQILLKGEGGGAVREPPLAFKFTRGSWETCEVAADLTDIANRTLEVADVTAIGRDQPVVIELTIERFADEREGAAKPQLRDDTTRELRVTGSAVRVQVVGGAGAAVGAVRDVIVWLPPGYDDPANAGRRYPVLYMQDGQNVFDFRPPTPAEWGADETATRLIEAGEIEAIIIAAIPHSGSNRAVEYLPADALGVEGRGDAYIDWLVREVVPRVERVVRASTDPADRGIGGSSLGGLVALRAGALHPEVFGRVLAESPSLMLRGTPVPLGNRFPWQPRTFIGVGEFEYWADGKEERFPMSMTVRKFGSLLYGQSGPDHRDRVKVEVTPRAGHDEHAWAARFDEALKHLYPVEPE